MESVNYLFVRNGKLYTTNDTLLGGESEFQITTNDWPDKRWSNMTTEEQDHFREITLLIAQAGFMYSPRELHARITSVSLRVSSSGAPSIKVSGPGWEMTILSLSSLRYAYILKNPISSLEKNWIDGTSNAPQFRKNRILSGMGIKLKNNSGFMTSDNTNIITSSIGSIQPPDMLVRQVETSDSSIIVSYKMVYKLFESPSEGAWYGETIEDNDDEKFTTTLHRMNEYDPVALVYFETLYSINGQIVLRPFKYIFQEGHDLMSNYHISYNNESGWQVQTSGTTGIFLGRSDNQLTYSSGYFTTHYPLPIIAGKSTGDINVVVCSYAGYQPDGTIGRITSNDSMNYNYSLSLTGTANIVIGYPNNSFLSNLVTGSGATSLIETQTSAPGWKFSTHF